MPRLSKLIERLGDRAENRFGSWYERHKDKFPLYIPTGLILWYFYGMFINSLRLGIRQTFHTDGEEIESIWVFNPIKNLFCVFTPFGLAATAVIVLLVCLITKKGYSRFSGYKYTRDSRGFDILPDGTHGSSGFLTEKEMREFLELGPVAEVKGMMIGKFKRHPADTDKYALYVAHRMEAGGNNNLLCIGAPGSGKSRGFIIPFLMGCAQRGESVFITDPKGELFEKLSPYFREKGHYVKAVNFLDMEHSDGWNCLYGLDTETQLVQTVANTIIANTSGPHEADDFWSRAELNLLMALLHYVANLKDDNGNLLPIEQRGLGQIYQILATQSVNEINKTLAELPPEHPAKGPHGLFLKARENLWGNIIIGLGNRLAIYQSQLVDKITRNHDVDLTLPGRQPCAYFVIISAQDSAYRFLSSLFFSLAIPQLSDYARLRCENGRLPVLVNFCLDEYCNIGYMDGMADALNSIRGFNMSCQAVVQSLSQWQEKYPGKEWENQLATFNQTLYMGCNDNTSAKYISEKCGKVTISVTNNQMPLMPLFSPVYTSTRPYSQTRSNTGRELMQAVRKNDKLKDIARYLGRFREIFAQGKKNGYAYGRGEKYSLELGNSLSRALTSELAMLATPETTPLFLRKYQQKRIKQYQRREPIYRGVGDIICCLDESDSTKGDKIAWGKAVALTLLDIAADGGRSFALIHFSGPGSVHVNVFRPGEYAAADKMTAAEIFLGGGTNFETPMRESVALMEGGGFERADIVFITDGECELSSAFTEQLRAEQAERGFTITGILLDAGNSMDFSLKSFCQKIYRTSELMGDEIVRDLVARRT